MNATRCFVVLIFLHVFASFAGAEDVIEFLSGAKARGKVIKIDTERKEIDIEITLAGKTLQRTYPYASVHAVLYKDKRYVLNEMKSASPGSPKTERKTESPSRTERSKPTPAAAATNVEALITEAGRVLPDWYETTDLNYPQTLDLSWPDKPPGGWNNQLNVGQFIWDVINPNPARWREGVRFLHHMLTVHQNDAAKISKIQTELGRMYFELLQDYPHAAYWYRQAGVGRGGQVDNTRHAAHLAECYYRLGNRKMAVDLMSKLPITYAVVKLWGDIGETNRCIELATLLANNSPLPAMFSLLVGDAYRMNGMYDKAILAYEQTRQLAQKPPNQARQAKFQTRAEASISALKLVTAIDLRRIADGAYRADSPGYEGPVEVEVTVAGGKIEAVRVTQHKEKQFYSSIEDTTAKIIKKQGVAGVDTTSGATITSEAIINATAKALANGTK